MSLFSTEGLTAIEDAIAGGYLEIRYDDKTVRYRTLDELLQVRDLIRTRLGSGTTSRKYVSFARDY